MRRRISLSPDASEVLAVARSIIELRASILMPAQWFDEDDREREQQRIYGMLDNAATLVLQVFGFIDHHQADERRVPDEH